MSGTMEECNMTTQNTGAMHCEEILQGRSFTVVTSTLSLVQPVHELPDQNVVSYNSKVAIYSISHEASTDRVLAGRRCARG